MNDLKAEWNDIRELAMQAVDRVGKSGWWILGTEVTQFETRLAEFWSLGHAVGCGNGLDAIEIALRAAGVLQGQKVLTTPLSAFATSLAILRAGAVPVFVDVDESGLLDLDQVEEVLEAHSDIRVLVPVHLFGHALSVDRLESLKKRFNLIVIEDCAQAIGAKSNGRPVGSASQLATTSFYPTKNLGALGDGGAVLTNDPELAKAAACLRDYGQTDKYIHSKLGLNSRLDELHAAMLTDSLLPKLAGFTQKRAQISDRYRRRIKNPLLKTPPIPEGSVSVWHLFPVLVQGNRESFRAHLQRHQIQNGLHYPKLIPDQEALGAHRVDLVLKPLKVAKRFSEQEVSLPIHPYLHEAEMDRVIQACNDWTG